MKVEHIHEVDLNDFENEALVVRALTHNGVWVPLMSLKFSESMVDCYHIPLILKLGCLEQADQSKEQLSESLLLTPQA